MWSMWINCNFKSVQMSLTWTLLRGRYWEDQKEMRTLWSIFNLDMQTHTHPSQSECCITISTSSLLPVTLFSSAVKEKKKGGEEKVRRLGQKLSIQSHVHNLFQHFRLGEDINLKDRVIICHLPWSHCRTALDCIFSPTECRSCASIQRRWRASYLNTQVLNIVKIGLHDTLRLL